MQKILKNRKILINEWIPHPQISLKQFSNICENLVVFLPCRGVEKWLRIFAKQKLLKKFKTVSFFYILQLPHTVTSNSKKLTHPTVQCLYRRNGTQRRRINIGEKTKVVAAAWRIELIHFLAVLCRYFAPGWRKGWRE